MIQRCPFDGSFMPEGYCYECGFPKKPNQKVSRMNFKRETCPNCHSKVEPGQRCVCGTLTSYDSQGRLVFTLGSPRPIVHTEEPGGPVDVPDHTDFSDLPADDDAPVAVQRISAANARGLDRPVNAAKPPRSSWVVSQVYGPDLEEAMKDVEHQFRQPGDPARPIVVGADLSSFLPRGGRQ